jgi:hypothetical protein
VGLRIASRIGNDEDQGDRPSEAPTSSVVVGGFGHEDEPAGKCS